MFSQPSEDGRLTVNGRLSHAVYRLPSIVLFMLANLIGALAYLYPFWLPVQTLANEGSGHAGDALIVFGLLVSLCLLVMLADMAGGAVNPKIIAVLGVLTAINAVARLAENILPLPAGFSPIFLLIILVGYCYGPRLGFLLGAFTIMVSALLGAGVGPWLPYEMLAAAWVGLSAGWLGKLGVGEQGERVEGIVLLTFGALWGFLYGAITNLYFWPFVIAEGGSWAPGLSPGEILQRYAGFYLATSLLWDVMAALGNVALLAVLGPPLLRALRRFRRRFQFEVVVERIEVGEAI
jgi:energy-coupling factor transport system substrate-specific component